MEWKLGRVGVWAGPGKEIPRNELGLVIWENPTVCGQGGGSKVFRRDIESCGERFRIKGNRPEGSIED